MATAIGVALASRPQHSGVLVTALSRRRAQPSDDASQAGPSGMREPAILVATRVVHAATALSSQPAPNAPSHSVGPAIARSFRRCQTVQPGPGIGPSYALLRPRFLRDWSANGPSRNSKAANPRFSRAFVSTATGIRSPPRRTEIGLFYLHIDGFLIEVEPLLTGS